MAPAASGIKTAADLEGKPRAPPVDTAQLDHAPGAAPVRRSHAGRHDHHAVPRLQPGRRARREGQVDAATGFANNDLCSCAVEGHAPSTILTGWTTSCPCPGPGLMVGTSTLASKHEALAAFVAVTLGAMEKSRWTPSSAGMPPSRQSRSLPPTRRRRYSALEGGPGRHDRHVVRRRDRERGTRIDASAGLDCVDRLPVVAPRGPCAQPCHGRPARHDRAPAAGQLSRSAPAVPREVRPSAPRRASTPSTPGSLADGRSGPGRAGPRGEYTVRQRQHHRRDGIVTARA